MILKKKSCENLNLQSYLRKKLVVNGKHDNSLYSTNLHIPFKTKHILELARC